MFKHEITILRETFGRLLRRHATTNLVKLIQKTHPADLAVLFRYFSEDEQSQVFNLMKDHEHTAQFMAALDDTILEKLLEDESPDRIAAIIQHAPTNDQSLILGVITDELAQSVLDLLKKEEQQELEELMGYPEDSAGALMTTDIFTLYQDTTCGDALKTLQDQEDAEMVFYLYITDEDDRLVGIASLRALATTQPDTILKDIMVKRVHTVRPETDQEDVAQIVAQYNYLAVPVL
ncbi:uncharacterized protein METZ01_LOCUS280286, partial [marine metagenome]